MGTTGQIAPHRPAEQSTTLRIYNTLSRSKEPFKPIRAGKVGIYLCGPTVYGPSHIGHMVGPVTFDAIKRYLTYSGYDVTLVINITDVDDKLINASRERGVSMAELAAEMTADYMQNLAAMGVDTVDHFPKATENMDEIIRFTEALIDKGFAYTAEGDVYFDVAKDAAYGKLSGRSVESMHGDGGEAAQRKRAAADFALWKAAKPDEPSWESPWGPGRPGWHIECSAMSRRLLGESFDMHGGGLDLIFPHHENELAQSECRHDKPQARYWVHNGLMRASHETGKVGGRATRETEEADDAAAGKMSRSEGARPFRDLLAKFSGETIRFFLLSTHYRSPFEFSDEQLGERSTSLEQFYRFFKRYERITGAPFYGLEAIAKRGQGQFDPGQDSTRRTVGELRTRFLEAMDDDFNTAAAIGALFEMVRALNRLIDDAQLEASAPAGAAALETLKIGAAALRELSSTLGLFSAPPQDESASVGDSVAGKLVELMIDIRSEARAAKNFALADRIRDGLGELGIELEDRSGGTDWTRK